MKPRSLALACIPCLIAALLLPGCAERHMARSGAQSDHIGLQLNGGSHERESASSGALSQQPHLAGKAVQNPSFYVSNTYRGGSGERDRLEKLIREGVLVDGKRVKLEAFSRTYAQAFPIPTRTALTVVAETERTRIVQEGERTFLQVGIQAMKGEAARRPALNVALVLDRSGSMQSEDKIEFARAAASQLVDRLTGRDVLALVTFDDRARVEAPSRRATDRPGLKRKIASLRPGGGTNIYDGLRLGYQEVRRHAGREGVNLVILLSDGNVTAGITDRARFERLAAAHTDQEIQTTAVGVGVDFNEDLMLAVAQAGQGNYHFIKDGADTQRVFASELDELTQIVARGLRLRIQLAPGVGLVRVLGAEKLSAAQTREVRSQERQIDERLYEELGIARDRRNQPDEPGIKMLIPNFYRGDSHVVMLEIAVPRGGGSRRVADVFLKYKDLVWKSNREAAATTTIRYTPLRQEMVTSLNRNVKKNLLGFQTGEALMEAAALIDQGQVADAVRKVDERMVVLGLAAREWGDRDLERDGKLLDRYKTMLAELGRQPQLAQEELGQYLKRSLTYNGYKMTR